MIRYHELQKKINGFMYKHLSYDDLRKIAVKQKIKIHEVELPPSLKKREVRCFGFYANDQFHIVMSSEIKNPNARWQYLCHELAHYFLHTKDDAVYIVNLNQNTFRKRKIKNENLIEAEANIFLQLAFVPLNYVRRLLYQSGVNLSNRPSSRIVKKLIDFTLLKCEDPKPKEKEIKKRLERLLDTYRVILSWQNILRINCLEMKRLLATKPTPDISKCPSSILKFN